MSGYFGIGSSYEHMEQCAQMDRDRAELMRWERFSEPAIYCERCPERRWPPAAVENQYRSVTIRVMPNNADQWDPENGWFCRECMDWLDWLAL